SLGNKKTIVRRKSSLSTFPPCLPSPALTDNIKNLPLSDPNPGETHLNFIDKTPFLCMNEGILIYRLIDFFRVIMMV
ncbi:MAG: hypothetical protein ACKPEO_21305, partial [Sphaerospermopsis kisseleviana]